jgi:hypothetical protein
MEHVVFFSEPSGEPSFARVADLAEAIRFVEELRNGRGIEDVSVQALTPVPVTFRTYYRVEVATAEPVADAPVASAPGAVAGEDVANEEAEVFAVEPFGTDDVAPDPFTPDPFVVEPFGADDVAVEEPVPAGDGLYTGAGLDEVPVPVADEAIDGFIPSARAEVEPEHSLGYFAR